MINAESLKNNNQLTVTKSSGGYTMTHDKNTIESFQKRVVVEQ